MIIQDFAYEFDSLTRARQKQGLETIFSYLVNRIEDNLLVIDDILEVLQAAEADDYFGTEGFDV